MLSPTPPGHWISIAMEILAREDADAPRNAEVLAKLGMAVADGFIGCWSAKYEHDLLRPVTYIKRVIDKTWEPMLITPPFPEYPSGHSSQSGAAATVLSDLFGEDYAFDDATHQADGLPVRHFTGFWPAAQEAARSRLYGGIHFRSAIDLGLEQGRCIGTHINNIRTRK
jgi:membrane-associated phospholipid phosphatase